MRIVFAHSRKTHENKRQTANFATEEAIHLLQPVQIRARADRGEHEDVAYERN